MLVLGDRGGAVETYVSNEVQLFCLKIERFFKDLNPYRKPDHKGHTRHLGKYHMY